MLPFTMRPIARSLAVFALPFALCLRAWADDPGPEPKTLLTERGGLLLKEDFNDPLSKSWQIMAPVWECVDGVLQATHTPPYPTNHGPVMQRQLAMKNVIVQVEFKLEGKARAVLHFNKANGHLCRALILPNAFYIIRRDSGPNDKGTRLDTDESPVTSDTWHMLVVELSGSEMVAALDNQRVLLARRDDLDQDKTALLLEGSNGTVWFKNMRVWQALPNKSWEPTRAKLQAARKPAAQ
jgi:hypothetical protein